MFENRTDAGRRLADLLADRAGRVDLVLAIPRGGLPVGRVVADRLGAPLDVVAARKLGAPSNPELAIGAVASDGTVWLNEPLIERVGTSEEYVEERIDRERAVAREKVERYRAGRPPLELAEKTVLLVDDGVATGATTIACLRQLERAGAGRVILAVPVAPPEAVERLRAEADEVICVETPPHFGSVGRFYESFEQVSDEEARAYLRASDA